MEVAMYREHRCGYWWEPPLSLHGGFLGSVGQVGWGGTKFEVKGEKNARAVDWWAADEIRLAFAWNLLLRRH